MPIGWRAQKHQLSVNGQAVGEFIFRPFASRVTCTAAGRELICRRADVWGMRYVLEEKGEARIFAERASALSGQFQLKAGQQVYRLEALRLLNAEGEPCAVFQLAGSRLSAEASASPGLEVLALAAYLLLLQSRFSSGIYRSRAD